MIDTSRMTPAEVRRAALRAVVREVGAAGLVAVLGDARPGRGDYTAERREWLPEFASTSDMLDAVAREGAPSDLPAASPSAESPPPPTPAR